MDITKIIELAIAALAGGVFQKVLGPILGLENSRIKSLTSIIDSLDERVKSLEADLKEARGELDELKNDKYSHMEKEAIYQYALDGVKVCEQYRLTGKCPTLQRLNQTENVTG